MTYRAWLATLGLSFIWLPVLGDTGEYLFKAAGCGTCHTAEDGPPLAGGRSFDTPFGVFYSPNITPDGATGIGRWTREQFVAALRQGRAPDGRSYYPVFPYPAYRLMSEHDAALIYDYLISREPVVRDNTSHRPGWWIADWMMPLWQWWYLDDTPALPSRTPAQRGRYLVDALGHCAECHSPRGWSGLVDAARYLAGNPAGPDGNKVPNITPHEGNGIGRWTGDDLDYFLSTGERPDGDYTGGAMADVIDGGTSLLTDEDRRAMVDYLRSITALP